MLMETVSVMRTRTDDLDGSPGAITRRFGLDGQDYEIDLGDENYAEMAEMLSLFVKMGRRVQPPPKKSRSKTIRAQSADIRAWAMAQGITVSENGRLPGDIKARYEAAH
jgi:Lsr2